MQERTREIVGWSFVGILVLSPGLFFLGAWIVACANGTYTQWVTIDEGEYQLVRGNSSFIEKELQIPIESASLQVSKQSSEGASVFTYKSSNSFGNGFEDKTIYLSFSKIEAEGITVTNLIVKPVRVPREHSVCCYHSAYECSFNGQDAIAMSGDIVYWKSGNVTSIQFRMSKADGPEIELSFQK